MIARTNSCAMEVSGLRFVSPFNHGRIALLIAMMLPATIELNNRTLMFFGSTKENPLERVRIITAVP